MHLKDKLFHTSKLKNIEAYMALNVQVHGNIVVNQGHAQRKQMQCTGAIIQLIKLYLPFLHLVADVFE